MFVQGDKMQTRNVGKFVNELEVSSSFFDLAALIFAVLDREGVVQMINHPGAELLGYRKDEIIGRRWTEVFVPAHAVAYSSDVLRECMEQGVSRPFECSVVTRAGAERIIGWRSAIIKDDNGLPKLFLMSGRDITNEKTKTESLIKSIDRIKEWNKELELIVLDRTRELQVINANLQAQIRESRYIQEQYLNSQRLYNAISHNFPNGIIGVLNKELQYLVVDGKELELYGLRSEDLIGRKIFHWAGAGREYDAHLKKAFEGENVSFEVSILRKIYNVTAVPLPNAQNRLEEILVVIHDITDRKELEESLYSIISQEKKLNELKTRFVTMALHEFRTPLSTILSSVFLLESYKGSLYEQKRDIHINRIKRTVNILTEILNDFLRLGKLEEGKVDMKLTAINISDHAEDVLKAVYPLKKKDQKLLYKHTGLDLRVFLDENLMRSILLNLLSNAIKYSHDDGEIVLDTHLSRDALVITVMDRGIGIAASEREHIFQRFFRGLNALNIEGTGLGLHIVKGYVELMKGTVDFESDDKGTVFTVKIPLQLTQDETRLILH